MASRGLRYGAAAATAALLAQPIVWNDEAKTTRRPIGAVLRAFAVYTACSVPTLVDAAPTLLRFTGSIPGISALSNALVRKTFYAQFVGGDTAASTLPLLRILRKNNVGCLFAYSVEDDEAASGSGGHKERVAETLRCISVAADFEDQNGSAQRKTWVAIKLSAFLPSAEPLRTLSIYLDVSRPPLPDVPFPGHARATDLVFLSTPSSSNSPPPGLSDTDVTVLRELWADLSTICAYAQKRRVRVIVDAEYSWWQPAIDAYTLALSRTFNKREPLVYGTYQAYLRRTPAQLQHALRDAKKEGYSIGVKLVRGAYHVQELARHANVPVSTASDLVGRPSITNPPPVWEKIEHTDASYAACSNMLLDAVAADISHSSARSFSWRGSSGRVSTAIGIGVLFGTHNARSAAGVVHGLVSRQLATPTTPPSLTTDIVPKVDQVPHVEIGAVVSDRVVLGQLYGMCDWLTDTLAERVKAPSPFVLKYLPYGALEEVMPYLARRALENKSVLGGRGGATEERDRARKELAWRLFGMKS